MYSLLDLDPVKRSLNLFTFSELYIENKSTLLTAECVSHHKMSGVNEEDLALGAACLFKLGEQDGAIEFKLKLRVGLSWNRASLTNFHTQALHEAASLTFTQPDPSE